MIAHERPLLVDTIAAMIEANRTMYREPDKVVPIIMDATQKPKDAVEYAMGVITKRCIWSVNDGFDKARTLWSIQFAIDNGDIQASKRPTFEDVVDLSLAKDALAEAGGPVTINNCKD